MTGLSDLGGLADEDAADLNNRVGRFLAAWKPDGSTGLEWFLPPPGERLRPLALVRIITADMERRAAAKLPFRCERYVNDFPEELSTNTMPVALLAAEYRLRQQHTDKPALSEYERWFPNQYEALKELVAQGVPAAPTGVIGQTPATPVDPFAFPKSGTHPESGRPPYAPPRPGLHTVDPNRSGMPADVLPNDAPYQLVRRLGSGAFGEVFEALAPGGVKVAVKRILRDVNHPASQSELEALEAIKQLAHPFLLKTNAYWIFDDKLVIVMDLADGSLGDRLEHHQKQGAVGVPTEELIPLFEQASEALDYLHSQNVSHRDVKPENILLLHGYAKVGDFGLARLHEHTVTTVGSTVGTPAYMAPEMWRQKVSLQSDQYSLAATYLRARLGRFLFSTNILVDMANSHLHETPNLDPLPQGEQEVLLKALAKKPEDRYPSCSAFAKALRAAVFPAPPPPPPPPPESIIVEVPKQRERSTVEKLLLAGSMLLACVAIAGVAYLFVQPRNQGADKADKGAEKDPTTPPTQIVVQQPPPPPEKPFAKISGDWHGDDKSEIKVIGEKRYHTRLIRKVNGIDVAALLIPKGGPNDPDTFYILEHKVTNQVFATVWEKIKNSTKVNDLKERTGLIAGKWQTDESGEKLDLMGTDADLPVLGVTVPEAILVAEELGGTLPTFDQWKKAAGLWEDGVVNGPAGGPRGEQESFADRKLALGRIDLKPLGVHDPLAQGDVSYWKVRQLVSNGKEWLGENARGRLSITSIGFGTTSASIVGQSHTDPFIVGRSELIKLPGEQPWQTTRDGAYAGFRVVFKPQ